MKLTKEFIELQGFRFQTYMNKFQIFTITHEFDYYELIWNQKDKMIRIDRYSDEDDDMTLYDGIINNVMDFYRLLVHFNEITNKSIALPTDFPDRFMDNKRFKYTELDFNDLCELCLVILIAKEDYEECSKLIEYRKKYYKKKKWNYHDIEQKKYDTICNIGVTK